MSKIGEVVLSYVNSTSKVWIYCLSLLLALTTALLTVEIYHEKLLYKAFHDNVWANKTNWVLLLCCVIYLEIIVTCICAFYEKNKLIKRYITVMYILNMLAIVAFLIWLPRLPEIKKRSKFILGEAMEKYSFPPLIMPSGAQYMNQLHPTQMLNTNMRLLTPNQQQQQQYQQQYQQQLSQDPRILSTQLWDYLQNYYKCCGIDNQNDWLEYSPQKKYYPRTCCSPFSLDKSNSMCKEVDSGRKDYGCMKPIKNLHIVSLTTFLAAIFLNLLLAAVCYIQGLRYEEYEK